MTKFLFLLKAGAINPKYLLDARAFWVQANNFTPTRGAFRIMPQKVLDDFIILPGQNLAELQQTKMSGALSPFKPRHGVASNVPNVQQNFQEFPASGTQPSARKPDIAKRQFKLALNTLLFFLRNIDEQVDVSPGAEGAELSIHELKEMALRETTRTAEVLSQLEGGVEVEPRVPISPASNGQSVDHYALELNNNLKSIGCAPAPEISPYQSRLSPREREVLALIVGGVSNKEGGDYLKISNRTFEGHRAKIMKKLKAKNAADLVRLVLTESR